MSSLTFSAKKLGAARGAEYQQLESEIVAAIKSAPNGEVRDLGERLEQYESVFRFSTEEMRARVANGSLSETSEICDWLQTAELRDLMLKKYQAR